MFYRIRLGKPLIYFMQFVQGYLQYIICDYFIDIFSIFYAIRLGIPYIFYAIRSGKPSVCSIEFVQGSLQYVL